MPRLWLDFTLEVWSSKKAIVTSWLMENWWEKGHSTTYNRDFLLIFTDIFTDINRYGSFHRYVKSADISALVLLPIPIYRFRRYWPYRPLYCIGRYRYANPTTYIPNFKVVGQAVQLWEWRRTDRRADRCYQVHYLPASRSIININIHSSMSISRYFLGSFSKHR